MTEPVIAVIDPDSNFLTTINETLAQSGYIAILSQGDPETQYLLQREHPSLIIIDGTMRASKNANGLLESVIADATQQHIPMLMTVTSSDKSQTDHDSLSKPIDLNELQRKLRSALGPLAVIHQP